MTIRMTSLPQFLNDVYASPHTGNNPICVKCYRAANDSEIKDLQGVFYMDSPDTVREWDDVNLDESGEQYNTSEFFADCLIWGIDLQDCYEYEKVVTVYIYRERL